MKEMIETFLIENGYQVVVLAICILITVTKYSRYFFASNIELILLKQKASQKKELSKAVLLFVVFSVCNVILSSDITFILFECVLLFVTFIVWLVSKIYYRIRKKSGKVFSANCELVIIIVGTPIIMGLFSRYNEIDIINIVVIGTLVETISLWLVNNGFSSQIDDLMVWNDEKSLFVYKIINDDYLLCGEQKEMKKSQKVTLVNIQDIYEGKFYLKIVECNVETNISDDSEAQRNK